MAYSNSKAEKALLAKIHKSGSIKINRIEDALVELIESQRTINYTDMILVQQLAAQLYVNQECLKDIITNGSTIETTSRGEQVIKENPNSRNFQTSSTQIQKLFKQLGLDPIPVESTEDEDTSVDDAFKQIRK
ncbi:P27 family phage terminase small subunit [Aeromonas sp. AE23HZ002T15]